MFPSSKNIITQAQIFISQYNSLLLLLFHASRDLFDVVSDEGVTCMELST